MKRFVTLAVTVLIGCLNCCAQSAKDIISKYASAESAESFSIDRKTFNLVKPLLPLDRQTKKLFKALNILQIDILNISKCQKAAAAPAFAEFKALSEDGPYSLASQETGKSLVIFKTEGKTVSEFVMLEFDELNSSLMLLRADCAADLNELSALYPLTDH